MALRASWLWLLPVALAACWSTGCGSDGSSDEAGSAESGAGRTGGTQLASAGEGGSAGSSSGAGGSGAGRGGSGGAGSTCPDECISVCEAGQCDCYCDPMAVDSYDCQADRLVEGPMGLGDPEQVAEVVGSNGTFVDHCDGDGNLVEYVCETELVCAGGINPVCTAYETGSVSSELFDCVGTCEVGSCEARCPEIGDDVTYLSVPDATTATFVSESDGREYQCDLIFGPEDTCNAAGRVGQTHTIISLGLRGGPCTGTDFGNIGLQDCSYRCDILPP